MKIGKFDTDKEVLIIAEIGNNHEGSYALAEEMIGLAAKAGAGAVKFQTIVPDKLISPIQQDRIEQLEKFRLTYDEFEKLSKVAQDENIIFLSTPFDIESARFLEPIVPAFKISSGDNNFFPMIDVIIKMGKPIIFSAGLTDLEQITLTKKFIMDIWSKIGIEQEMAILHCVTSYPTPLAEANLLSIRTLQELGVTVGYSDHTIGIEAAVISVALGARIIEKHFTIAKDYSDFHDHQLSADPHELSELVRRTSEVNLMLGNGGKRIVECEKNTKEPIRRSIVAVSKLSQGTVLELDHLSWVRPGGGLSPGREHELLGKVLRRSLKKGEIIVLDDVCDDEGGK